MPFCNYGHWIVLHTAWSLYAMVFHPGDMSCIAKLCFEERDLHAGNINHVKDIDVGEEDTPMDVSNGT